MKGKDEMPISPSSSSSRETQTLTSNAEPLIPGLPDDISSIILSLVPFSHHDRVKPTSKSWKTFLSSKLPFHLSRWFLHDTNPHPTILCIFPQDPSLVSPYLFDPRHGAWRSLPPAPCSPHSYGLSNFAAVCLGRHLYVLGGSLFDNRSYPNCPHPSAATLRLDLTASSLVWESLSPMRTPRGSFACAAIPSSNSILIAGGGSRHALFGAAGTRLSTVERFDSGKDHWVLEENLPRFRAGCIGFLGGEKEFWVMGGYGNCRMISGVFPVDEHYRDGAVMDLESGKWREIGNMWEEGERGRLGTVVVIDGVNGEAPGIFMLDRNEIFRYNAALNRWRKESSLPKKTPRDSSCGFVALGGELYVMFASPFFDFKEIRRPRLKRTALFIQVYNPKTRAWRHQMTKPPSQFPLNFKTAVMCTIRL
ncbi:hypothetical protein MRB53_019675 [Persea americana]|uniref:Uncharacterized protein n=1 Tax=Persea americana TaxID=3435 RepID=A0ACC2L019_PERAE|nr:hypothetical protein MRB53_019675 [Persea americana]